MLLMVSGLGRGSLKNFDICDCAIVFVFFFFCAVAGGFVCFRFLDRGGWGHLKC